MPGKQLERERVDALQQQQNAEQNRGWHAVPAEEAAGLLEVSPETGLTLEEVEQRRQKHGRNELTPKKARSGLVRFLLQFHQPLIYILLAASLITALLQEWVDSAVILGVVLINAFVGYLQEAKAISAIAALSRSLSRVAHVLRQGQRVEIESVEVVPGDILILQAGDQVPGDARLLGARELRVAEAALTGESVPVEKRVESLEEGTGLADRVNMVYSSTFVTNGTGRAVVTSTGDHTEIGRISKLVAEAENLQTPLTRNVNRFSHILLYAILGMAALTFAFGIWTGQGPVDMFMAAVALAVGAIPEGLPAALTITLAIGVSRMAARRAVIRKLPAVETLGSTTIICSDKTGTLTQNEMTVTEILAGGESVRLTGIGYDPEGGVEEGGEGGFRLEEHTALEACVRAGYLCNDSRHLQEEGRWVVQGDPTEGALLVTAKKLQAPLEEWHDGYPRLAEVPFESEHKYMATMHGTPEGGPITYLKGALEKVLERCKGEMDARGEQAALGEDRIREEAERMAAAGLRVLALACRTEDKGRDDLDRDDVQEGFLFLGLQGMTDPPRPEAIEAVHACRRAGIQVKMITGDHLTTAEAIAREIGIIDEHYDREHAHAMDGRELAEKQGEDFREAADKTSVFARVTPEQKLRLVEALQERHHVVAVTGDGVNDAPALKRADIGVAMGVTGTEVAKDAADMVLTDDNFATLRDAVEEGRGIYDNIVKFMVWTLPTNIGEGLVILTAIMLQTALPILPVQILWINMTTAVLIGLTLAFEPKEPGLMERAPRPPKSPMIPRDFYFRMFLVGFFLLAGAFGLFYLEMSYGARVDYARTVALNVFVVFQTLFLFNCRSLTRPAWAVSLWTNKLALAGAATMISLQLMITYVPVMNGVFHTEPISLMSWAEVVLVAVAAFWGVELEKWVRRRFIGYSPEWQAAHSPN